MRRIAEISMEMADEAARRIRNTSVGRRRGWSPRTPMGAGRPESQ
jgi:hypothetical protein